MLTDLSKYITKGVTFKDDSIGFFFKEIIERMHDGKFAEQVRIRLTNNAIEQGFEGACYLIEDLICDYHMQDLFSYDTRENILFRMVMDCFDVDYDFEVFLLPEEYYADYTVSGCEEYGNNPNFVAEWIEEYFEGFIQECKFVKENDGDFGEFDFRAMHFVVDASNQAYYDIVTILYDLGFVELEPGFFLFASLGYCDGYNGGPGWSHRESRRKILEILEYYQRQRVLSNRDTAALAGFDGEESCIARALLNLKRYNRKDVMM